MSGDNESLDSPWRGGIHGAASVHPSYEGDEYDVSGQGGRPGADYPFASEESSAGIRAAMQRQPEDPHDLVIKDILSREPQWDLSVGSARHIRDRVADDLLRHKAGKVGAVGVKWQVSSSLQHLLNTYRGLLGGAVDARARLLEIDPSSLEYLVLFDVYDQVVSSLPVLRRLLDAASE
jgi:hypothetical protein